VLEDAIEIGHRSDGGQASSVPEGFTDQTPNHSASQKVDFTTTMTLNNKSKLIFVAYNAVIVIKEGFRIFQAL
jgi:hypothetical protein